MAIQHDRNDKKFLLNQPKRLPRMQCAVHRTFVHVTVQQIKYYNSAVSMDGEAISFTIIRLQTLRYDTVLT